VKPSIRVKNQNELNLPAPEKEKKSGTVFHEFDKFFCAWFEFELKMK